MKRISFVLGTMLLASPAFALSCKDATEASQPYCQPGAKEVKNFRSKNVGEFVADAGDRIVVKVDGKTRMWAVKSTSRAQ